MLDDTDIVARSSLSSDAGLEGRTFVVQGLGNIGYWTAHFIHANGGKIAAIGERDGVVTNYEDDIDPNALRAYLGEKGKSKDISQVPSTMMKLYR